MSKINLLPWRDGVREARKNSFFVALLACVVFAGIIIFIGDLIIGKSIRDRRSINKYLESEISILEQKAASIKGLKEKKVVVLKKMAVIKGLQGNRPMIVRMFDELVRIVPEDVYFKTLVLKNKSITLVGIADSNNAVSKLMRRISSSQWFASPSLTGVRKVSEYGERLNEFDLIFNQVILNGREE
ncbi:MAG: PilN domain-containing protein [Candidatus Endonucleobacter bathymodioli]|uniref:PilN domain-containing protein n=1 Tax=Candidatus Endonucleibacter bathymodioli TaxID=539814 RepID=A0AA90SLW6_9GAMM|nr:PilN domain-containing protein [Candidatus Endonucleobacter bathymodioli]